MKPYLKHALIFLAPIVVMVACGPTEIKRVAPAKDPNGKEVVPEKKAYQTKVITQNAEFEIEATMQLADSKEKMKGLIEGKCIKAIDEKELAELKGIAILPNSKILLLKTKIAEEIPEDKKGNEDAAASTSPCGEKLPLNPSGSPAVGTDIESELCPNKPAGETTTPAPAAEEKPEEEAKPAETTKPEEEAKPAETAKPEEEAKPAETAKPEEEAKVEELEVIDEAATTVLTCDAGGRPIISEENFKNVEIIKMELDKPMNDIVFATTEKSNSVSYQVSINCRDNKEGEVVASSLLHKDEITIFKGSYLVLRRDLEHKMPEGKNIKGKDALVVYSCN